MSWTAWIQIESEDTSNVEAKQLYEKTRNPVNTGNLRA